MAEIEKVKLPNDDTIYDIKDAKAIRGLASGTTSGHVLQFGVDGYTVSDSGKSMSDKQDTIDSSHKLSADLVDNSTPTFATATQGGKADTAVQTIKVNSASTGVTKTGDTVDITAIPASIVSAGALASGMTATTQSTSDDSTKLATTAFVHDVVDELPEPMIFKSGMTLTADSTDTTKCAITVTDPASASDIKVGYTYKVTNISGTYTGTIKVGDTLIAKKNAPKVDKTWVVDTDWTVVPSGDETGYVVGKASGTTQNNLVKWGADGYTVDDSGIAVETSFSGTSDAKVPTSKSIKTNVADNAVLTGFTPVVTPSAIQDVASTDTITDAMEKLDNNTRLNENNILSKSTIAYCETATNTAAKVATVTGDFVLQKGCLIAVKYKYSNGVTDTESTPITLNVNSTGAYRIWYKNGEYVNATQGKIFGFAGYYVYYMFDGVDRWVWVNYSMDNTYSSMTQSEASTGTSTNERLISAKVLSDTIDEKLVPVENNISTNTTNISAITLSTATAVTGDLNSVSSNEFKAYTSSTDNLPSTDYCFVRTSIYSSTAAIQEAFVISTGVSYIRTMSGGEWNNWLRITNV